MVATLGMRELAESSRAKLPRRCVGLGRLAGDYLSRWGASSDLEGDEIVSSNSETINNPAMAAPIIMRLPYLQILFQHVNFHPQRGALYSVC